MKENKNKTTLTLEIGDRLASVQIDGIDPTSEDLLEAFLGVMVSQTFLPVTVLSSMKDFAEEHIEYAGNDLPEKTVIDEEGDQ